MACCNPCSAQTARKWRLIHGSPKSRHNEVFLGKENKQKKEKVYLMHMLSVLSFIFVFCIFTFFFFSLLFPADYYTLESAYTSHLVKLDPYIIYKIGAYKCSNVC